MKKLHIKLNKRSIAALVILLILALPFLVNAVVTVGASPYIKDVDNIDIQDADCIIVLGALVYNDRGALSPVLKDRVDTAIDLYNKGVSSRLLMSGDHGRESYDEVNSMLNYASKQGISPKVIFLDHAGFSTYESMYRARDIFQCKKVVIVTQKYHLYRAVYDARALGLDAYGVAADRQDYGNLLKTQAVREFLARCKDFVYAIFQPKPTYLGDAIPIFGDSSPTHDKPVYE